MAAPGPAALAASRPIAAVTVGVTCTSPNVHIYHADALGQLRRWDYAAPLDGSSAWTQQLAGNGWGGLDVFSGGDGVLYTIDASGDLRWYQDDGAAGAADVSWDPGSGAVIGTGWDGYPQVASGGQGVIYAVDPSGDLHWYRYLGSGGTGTWADGSGTVIGSGWGGYTQVVSGGDGILYTVDGSGTLYWHRQQDPTADTSTWADGGSGTQIGTGWAQFDQIGSVGGGVLFARDATGTMWWYRDTDPLGGTSSWADAGVGVSEGTGWGPAQVVGDIAGCTAH
jgi:hypothetical protein